MNNRLLLVNIHILSQFRLTVLAALLSSVACFGQTTKPRKTHPLVASKTLAEDTAHLDVNQDIAVQLLPFEDLLQTAVSHSPFMRYQNEVANAFSQAQQVTKLQILQNVSGYMNYSTGNQAILSTGIGASDQLAQITNGYRVGVEVRLPLYELFGRRHQVQQASSNYRAALVQKEILAQQLQRELINVYQDMITAQQLVKTHLLDEQASLTALRLAEVDLQRGRITADAMSTITSRYVQAKVGAEQAQGDFSKQVHLFEMLVGVPIHQLKRY